MPSHPFRLAACLLVAAVACQPLSAQPLVRLDVVDRDTGQWLPEHRHRGDAWIAGTPGHRYGVRLTNTTGGRVLVVLSIDGVNAVSGETADPAQGGYVLDPWQSAEISGWRKSMDDVAQFVFTDLPDSYAARTGRPANVGTIGIAVFREREQPVPPPYHGPPIARDSEHGASKARAAAPAAEADAASGVARQSIGTGHGQREWAPVQRTAFERASRRPDQVSQLRYDDEATLVALGVLPRPGPYRPWSRPPTAFPGGFVPDPAW